MASQAGQDRGRVSGTLSPVQRAEAMRDRGVKPLVPYPGANEKWKCLCLRCGEVVHPRYDTVVNRGNGGCDFCAKRDAAAHRFAAAEQKYLKLAEQCGFEPKAPYPGALGDWLLKCKTCGETKLRRTSGLNEMKSCGPCGQARRSAKKLSADKVRADELFARHKVKPTGEFKGWAKTYPGICLVCKSPTKSSPRRIESGAHACFKCSRQVGAKKRRDSTHTPEEAAQIMLEAGCEVDDVSAYPGTSKTWPGRCTNCGLRTKTSLGNIKNGHGPCKPCAMSEADSAFDYFGPALLYFIEHEQLNHFKLGIMGSETNRLREHKSKGWSVIETWDFDYGYEANYVEQYCLEAIYDYGVPNKVRAKDMPQGGHKETFKRGYIEREEVVSLVLSEIEKERWPIPKVFASGEKTKKARRACEVVENGVACTEKYSAKGCCRRHYLALREHGDPTFRVHQVFTNTTCEVMEDGTVCGAVVSKKGMCSVHYYRDYEYGDPLALKRPTPKARTGQCSMPGCLEEDYSLSFCMRHYHANRKAEARKAAGKPEPVKYDSDFCKVKNCSKPRTSLGYCHNHYGLFKKYGDPLGSPRGPVAPKSGKCKAEECEKPDDSKGLCNQHYSREYKRRKKGRPSLLD